MDQKFVKRLISTLISRMRCGVCGQGYEAGRMNVLGHQDDLWFLAVCCPSCHTQALVAAVIQEGKQPQLVSDLSGAEVARFAQGGAIGADEVLDMHEFLKGFNGDFSQFFSKK